MVLPGGKVIATKTAAAVGGALVAVAGVTVGVMLVLNGQKSYRNISVIDTIGGVCITRKNVEDSFDAYKGMNLFAGDDVMVGAESELDMQLDDDKYVYIEENTHMWLEADGDADNSKTIIYLNEGAVLNRIDNKLNDASYYKVETPNSTMAVRGTVVRVYVYEDESGIVHTDYAVPDGTVEIQLHTVDGELVGEPFTVPQGYQVKTRGDETFSEIVLQPYKGEDEEIIPINLKELSPTAHKNMSQIVLEGRDLYVGDRVVSRDETHVFLVDPDEEPEVEEPVEETEEPQTIDDIIEKFIKPVLPVPTPTIAPVEEEILPMSLDEYEPEEEGDSEDSSEPEEEITPTPTPTPEVKTYIVTFQDQNGNFFGQQTVEEGQMPVTPKLMPTSNGNWDNIEPVTGNTTITWLNSES